jgi:hypothetical protein
MAGINVRLFLCVSVIQDRVLEIAKKKSEQFNIKIDKLTKRVREGRT